VSLALAALLFTAACGKAGSLGPEGAQSASPADESLAFTRLRPEPYSFTYHSGLTDSARVVVRDARAWEAVWRDVWRNHTPVPALPAIDFEREMVVVAALGSRRSGGYGILVEGATRTADGVEVSVLKQSPGPRCGNTAAITTPADIARLRRVEGAVRFRERSEVRECR
jgi:hypothetical protein